MNTLRVYALIFSLRYPSSWVHMLQLSDTKYVLVVASKLIKLKDNYDLVKRWRSVKHVKQNEGACYMIVFRGVKKSNL